MRMLLDGVLVPELWECLNHPALIDHQIFAVGGCVRDALLGTQSADLDFVVSRGAVRVARSVADRFHGAFFVLDSEREIARAIIQHGERELTVDFAQLRGNTIEEDLSSRDFSINALAVKLSAPSVLIDPLGGQEDLRNGLLRPCRADAFIQDPVRTLRAVRFLTGLQLKIESGTEELIKNAAPLLLQSSPERIRDELFHILQTVGIKRSLEHLQKYGLFDVLFPELVELGNVYPGLPHHHSVLVHTYRTMEIIQDFCAGVLNESEDIHANPFFASARKELSPFKKPLEVHLFSQINPPRSELGLLMLAVLYHDAGKAIKKNGDEEGHSANPEGHADSSAELFLRVAGKFTLSNAEKDLVCRLIKFHMRAELKSTAQDTDYAMHVYNFYKDTGAAGILILLMHLADIMATYEQDLNMRRWQIALQSVARLMDGWFNRHERWISPPALIDGDDLIAEFGLEPGEMIGAALEHIRQAQVRGEVSDRASALCVAQQFIRGERYG